MASPEGKKGGQQQRRRSNGSSADGSPQQQQLSLRAPVIRHRDPGAPVVISGWLFKQGSDGLMLWKKRWFVLSQYCLFYYHGPDEEKVLGSLLLPGYTIRPCLAGDRDRFVYRKYAFKAEHRNTRSFYLAADSRPSMIQWMNALSLAAILHDSNNTSELNRSGLDVSVCSSSASGANGNRRPSKAVEQYKAGHDASFDSQPATGYRQPLYANAPPKPRRALNTSRDSHCSSSPSPERPPAPSTPSSVMQQQFIMRSNGKVWPQHRPVSAEVTALMHQQRQRNSPQQAERRTPDAYGRFKTEYEDVYNNSSSSGSAAAYVVTHRSEMARRVPPRPHSVDFLQQQGDYWASEQHYAQQVRQSCVIRKAEERRVVRDPAEISRDVKESALWSYVQPPLSTSQENLLEEAANQQQQFPRSASARLPKMAKQQPDLLNSSLAEQLQPEMDNKRLEQREESMKRLLEWKQRMLQSPLTKKSAAARSSERSTPTLPSSDAPSPRLLSRIASPVQPSPAADFGGSIATMRRAAQDLLQQERIYQQQNVAFRASLKRPDEEADVRKEFTYEYVVDGEAPQWPGPSLMREKSSAMADLRARSESPSANKVLVLKDVPLVQQMAAKARPKPPPKPSLHDQALYLKREQEQRLSFAESLPESLAGFAATIVSEGSPTVSPLISECDWNNTTVNGCSPAPLPDLMSLTSHNENVYMNEQLEDHYLPMTSAKLTSLFQPQSPPPLPAANEENAYVEMTDNGEIKTPPGKQKSVFEGVCDPSYRSPESPRYQEIQVAKEDQQPHYEFIYRASSHAEPVYMEVPQGEQNAEPQQPRRERFEEPESPSKLLDLIITPPRHPRFSISDTFRPASFFLQRLETMEENESFQHHEEESDSELVSPPPIPTSPPPQHSRSQSLDTSQDYFHAAGRSSRCSLASNPSSELSRRRPLTIVRSLEDLLVEDNVEATTFQGSTQSLASPLYENVATNGQVGAHHVRQASRISTTASPAGSERPRSRLNSALSISSTVSARSEQSAPYYYSDLKGQLAGTPASEDGSLRSSRSAQQAQAAKQAYQHSMDRLRNTMQRRQSNNNSTSTLDDQRRPEEPERYRRAQTPDLLANRPELTPPGRPVDVMRRVRSLEGLLDADDRNSDAVSTPAASETPRYTREPTTSRPATKTPLAGASGGESSPWDEDQLWRDKLRRASIRHTRSMDMLDQETANGQQDETYERLLQYSATLERTKRGQTYLDGYTWDEMEQRFRKPGRLRLNSGELANESPSRHFLEDGLPPRPTFEIDREKLRQWDLMSTAPVPTPVNEGGRRPAAPTANNQSESNPNYPPTYQHDRTPAPPGGSSPVQAVAAGLSHGKNGIKVAYHQSGLTGRVSSSVVVQQPTEIYHSDSDAPPKKGKLPPMIGHDQPNGHKVQLSAGDLLGRTHEELVLLLIQLRRQSSALVKARDACLLEMESQVKLAALDISHRQECLIKTGELKHHVKELEKQLEKLKPMISLVDNMVKLGSSSSPQKQRRTPETAIKRNLTPLLHQQTTTMVFHSTPQRGQQPTVQGWEEAQISQLESKHHQLAQLEKFVREEGAAIQRLTRNQQVLRMAIRGIRQQTNGALQKCDYNEVERCRQQQLFLERELSQIHSLLALSSKRLEDAAVEISRIEREISSLHQQLHRNRLQPNGNNSLNRSSREMAWLEAELNRVQQHVSQLQTRRQELSTQVNRLTSSEYFHDVDETWNNSVNEDDSSKRRPLGTWCETDLDSLNTVDRLVRKEETSMAYAGYYQPHYDDNTVDINEADERMKRYYGIVPKQPVNTGSPAAVNDKGEIRTVRIVKRESEKRQRSKPRYDDMDELTEEESVNDDPLMDDPVISQFSHVLTLPRKGSKRDDRADKRSQRNSIAGSSDTAEQWRGSLRPRRNLSALSLGNSSVSLEMESSEEGLGSMDSTQRSPVLTPVYTSDAAREIVEEMRRQDMISARRAVPRHKRRHITISCSQPLALEALSKTRFTQGRARDDVDLQRALRFHHPFAPDVVRSTINQAIRINEKTIDKLLMAPDKIVIPERYVPEQEVEEMGEEEKQKRLKKTESIRRMLTGNAAVNIPRPPSIAASNDNIVVEPSEAKQLMAKERQQRELFIGLNQMLVEEIKEKSKMAAAQGLSMESQYAA